MKRSLALLFAVTLSLPSVAADVGVIAFGDWGSGDANQTAVARAVENFCPGDRCDLTLLLGDNFYPAGVRSTTDPYWQDRFIDVYQRLDMPFYACLGNHDYGGSIQAQIDYTALSTKWRMPARYYDFTRGDADFFAIDTERFDATQRDWLEAKLTASKAPWRIVFGHHPIYSYGPHGDSGGLKQTLLPLLKAHVDLYLSGHDHTLQVLRKEGRTHFVVSGAGGMHTYRLRSPRPRALWAASQHGFSHLRITPGRIRLRMLTSDGAVPYDAELTR